MALSTRDISPPRNLGLYFSSSPRAWDHLFDVHCVTSHSIAATLLQLVQVRFEIYLPKPTTTVVRIETSTSHIKSTRPNQNLKAYYQL